MPLNPQFLCALRKWLDHESSVHLFCKGQNPLKLPSAYQLVGIVLVLTLGLSEYWLDSTPARGCLRRRSHQIQRHTQLLSQFLDQTLKQKLMSH